MASARQKQFYNAVTTIEEYVQKNQDLCNLGGDMLTSDDYKAELFTGDSCTVTADSDNIISYAGYDTEDIASITYTSTEEKFTIDAATAGNGQFKNANAYPAE